MNSFTFARATSPGAAVAAVSKNARAAFLDESAADKVLERRPGATASPHEPVDLPFAR